MDQISRFAIWICQKFDRSQIERIIKELQTILANKIPDVKLKEDLKKNIRTTGNTR